MDNNTNNVEVQQAVTAALDEQKKKKRKKRLILLAVVAVIIILIIALASGGNSDSSDGTKDTKTTEVAAEKEESVDGKIGDYICTVKSAEVCKDWEGKDAVKITYSFTNNNKEPQSFDIALADNVYQDGVELEDTFIDADEDDWGVDVKIKQGVTKEVIKVYKLRDKTTDLEVEIGEWLSFDDTKVKTTVKINK
ncbi:MAG: DUF5067 domain-containing protein [Ruminococcaceae bacterium]|nr:DUF5067 domain-containing protein [Oscillospiraceae bacterium]